MVSFKDQGCHHCGNVDLDILQNPTNKKYYVECIDCEARGPEGKSKQDALNLWRKDDKAKLEPKEDGKQLSRNAVEGAYFNFLDDITARIEGDQRNLRALRGRELTNERRHRIGRYEGRIAHYEVNKRAGTRELPSN